jgi:hypothetical protein
MGIRRIVKIRTINTIRRETIKTNTIRREIIKIIGRTRSIRSIGSTKIIKIIRIIRTIEIIRTIGSGDRTIIRATNAGPFIRNNTRVISVFAEFDVYAKMGDLSFIYHWRGASESLTFSSEMPSITRFWLNSPNLMSFW